MRIRERRGREGGRGEKEGDRREKGRGREREREREVELKIRGKEREQKGGIDNSQSYRRRLSTAATARPDMNKCAVDDGGGSIKMQKKYMFPTGGAMIYRR